MGEPSTQSLGQSRVTTLDMPSGYRAIVVTFFEKINVGVEGIDTPVTVQEVVQPIDVQGIAEPITVQSIASPVTVSSITNPVSISGSVTTVPSALAQGTTTLLASGTRAAETSTADQTSGVEQGVQVFINVTSAPGIQTLTPLIEAKDPLSGNYLPILTLATPITATGLYSLLMYPGALVSGIAAVTSSGARVPIIWRVRLLHSGAGNWTYSVSRNLLA